MTGMEPLLATARTINISPAVGTPLAASPNPFQPSKRIHGELEANLLLLEQGDRKLVIISFDLLYVGEGLRTGVLEKVMISPDELLMVASHTHSGPMVDETKPQLGVVDDKYLGNLVADVAGTLNTMLETDTGSPVSLRCTSGISNHSINRRLPSKGTGEILIAPNPAGPVDDVVTTVQGVGLDGLPLFTLWNFACHPVAYPDPAAITAHFPGVVRDRIRGTLARGNHPVLFLQGFSGDCRPSGTATPVVPKDRLIRLLKGPGFARFTMRSYRRWAESLAECVLGILTSSEDSVPVEFLRSVCRELPLGTIVDGEFVESRSVSVQTFTLEPVLELVAVSAEVVAEYSYSLRASSTQKVMMLAGCAGDVFGYAPTLEMVREGGYESNAYLPFFSLRSLNPNVETVLQDLIASTRDS